MIDCRHFFHDAKIHTEVLHDIFETTFRYITLYIRSFDVLGYFFLNPPGGKQGYDPT